MMFKSASVIAVLAAISTLSAYGAPIGYSGRTSGRAIAINRDVHQPVTPIAINRDLSSSEIVRRIVDVTSTDEHTPPNEKRTGPSGPPGPPGVRPPSPEHYRNMQKPGGPKGDPKWMSKGGPPPPGMNGQSPPLPNTPVGNGPPGFCPCASTLQPDGSQQLPGDDQNKPGPPPSPSPVDAPGDNNEPDGNQQVPGDDQNKPGAPPSPSPPPVNAPADDNEPNPSDDSSGSGDPSDGPSPNPKPDGVNGPGGPSPTEACDDTPTSTSTPDDSQEKKRFHTRSGDRIPENGSLGKALGKGLLELNPDDDGVMAKAPEHSQRTHENRDDWKRIPPKFIRRHVPPSVLNSYWS
ncbi:hypothetical protein EYR36_008494 [Pleurotus pulmonarius]|nr:hypothetical protein EYR36_008494 [Pleurotus pulmonarius]